MTHGPESNTTPKVTVQNMLGDGREKLTILHINVQSVRSIVSDLEVLCREYCADVVCVNEHWLLSEELNMLNVEGYRVMSGFCRSRKLHGGVCILVRASLNCDPVDVSYCAVESHCEVAGIFMADYDMFVFTMYRTPDSSYEESVSNLSLLLNKIKLTKYKVIITGDFNVHFDTVHLNVNDLKAKDFCNLLTSYGLKQTVFF